MIYQDMLPVAEFKRFIWRDGDRFLNILWGVNFSGGKLGPVYLPLLRVWRSPGNFYIETPWALTIFMRRKPYVWIERRKGITLEDE